MPDLVLGEHFDIGNREVYEDRCAAREIVTRSGLHLALAVVADGVGGEDKGERAAQLALDTFFDHVSASTDQIVPRLLTRAIQAANQAVFLEVRASGSKTMSTTFSVAAVQDGKTLYISHVGDSRIYFCRGSKLTQLTVDHTFATMVNRLGELAPGVGVPDRRSEALVRAVGLRERVAVDIGFYVGTHDPEVATPRGLKGLPLREGDSILVCSDGLTKISDATGEPFTREHEITHVLQTKSGSKAAQTLVSYALGRNVDDNVSVALLQVLGGRNRTVQRLRQWSVVIVAAALFVLLVILTLLSLIQP
jgi:serine/threonine protein phosphatase PrpC